MMTMVGSAMTQLALAASHRTMPNMRLMTYEIFFLLFCKGAAEQRGPSSAQSPFLGRCPAKE